MENNDKISITKRFNIIDSDLHYFELYCNGHNNCVAKIDTEKFFTQFKELQEIVYAYDNFQVYGERFNKYPIKIAELLDKYNTTRCGWDNTIKYYGNEVRDELITIGYNWLGNSKLFKLLIENHTEKNNDYIPSQGVMNFLKESEITENLFQLMDDIFRVNNNPEKLYKYETIVSLNDKFEIDNENQQTSVKLKWLGTVSQFGFIINELIGKGYIEKPTSSFPKDAKVYLSHFDINTTVGSLIKEINENSNSIAGSNAGKLSLPPINKLP